MSMRSFAFLRRGFWPCVLLLTASHLVATAAPPVPAPPPRLKVSEDKRHLVTAADGKPFFWLGDTAWELFHRLNREEAVQYLQNRAELGFTVIQAVAVAELEGLNTPNAYGHQPFIDRDPTKLAVKDGPENDYWDHVDFIVSKANALSLTIGFLPTWGDKWRGKAGEGEVVFTPDSAAVYGEWLGRRYKDKGLVWILGGDRPVENDGQREILRRLALGLRQGDGGAHLITFHPPGGRGSAEYLHNEPWLDFNMRQNGHGAEFTGHYDKTKTDYDRVPTKPVLDGEPLYEDHPLNFKARDFGHSVAADVRRPLYWDLFSGAFGHTYGHHSVWQMAAPNRQPVNDPLMPWTEAIHQPGAAQMQYGRWLMESRPYMDFVPDQDVIVKSKVVTSVPGAGRYYFAATRTKDGSCAMVYVPCGRKFSVNLSKISGPEVTAWWFNPRNGQASPAGTFRNSGEREFSPPDLGETLDSVLVLDDAAKKFPPPGTRR